MIKTSTNIFLNTQENYIIDDVDSDDTHADIGHGLGLADAETLKPDSASSKIDSTDDRWYKGKKLDLNWLLLAESCLELSREEQKDKKNDDVPLSLAYFAASMNLK